MTKQTGHCKQNNKCLRDKYFETVPVSTSLQNIELVVEADTGRQGTPCGLKHRKSEFCIMLAFICAHHISFAALLI